MKSDQFFAVRQFAGMLLPDHPIVAEVRYGYLNSVEADGTCTVTFVGSDFPQSGIPRFQVPMAAGDTVMMLRMESDYCVVAPLAIAAEGIAQTYTPVISQGVSSNIAKTVNRARYVRQGAFVLVEVDMDVTGTGTSGSNVAVTLPVNASAAIATQHVGSGAVKLAGTVYQAHARLQSTSNINFARTDVTNATLIGGSGPAGALANNDFIRFTAQYLIS